MDDRRANREGSSEAMGLTPLIYRRLQMQFPEKDWKAASAILAEECNANLPFADTLGSDGIERVQASALKNSTGSLDSLRSAVKLAQADWRDSLVMAGFDCPGTHIEWLRSNFPTT